MKKIEILYYYLYKVKHTQNMSGITNAIRRLFTSQVQMPPLGRWKPSYGQSMFERIDRANMDHCGTCNYNNFIEETKKNKKSSKQPK